MFIETGLLNRPVADIYEAIRQERYSDVSFTLYRMAFGINNPTYKLEDDIDSNPFFEFIIRNHSCPVKVDSNGITSLILTSPYSLEV